MQCTEPILTIYLVPLDTEVLWNILPLLGQAFQVSRKKKKNSINQFSRLVSIF